MASIQVSRLVRLALEDRFSTLFNDLVAEACSEYGVTPYAVNFAELGQCPQNFYRSSWDLQTLITIREPEFPVLCMWTADGSENLPGGGRREMPRTFSGGVYAYWRFFLSIKGLRSSGLTDLREATESAMIACLASEFYDTPYHGDLTWAPLNEQIWVDQDEKHIGFIQQVDYRASFEVNV